MGIVNAGTLSLFEWRGLPGPLLLVTARRYAMSFVPEMWRFLRARKKYWLVPIILINLVIGGALVLAQGSAVAPFIYTLF